MSIINLYSLQLEYVSLRFDVFWSILTCALIQVQLLDFKNKLNHQISLDNEIIMQAIRLGRRTHIQIVNLWPIVCFIFQDFLGSYQRARGSLRAKTQQGIQCQLQSGIKNCKFPKNKTALLSGVTERERGICVCCLSLTSSWKMLPLSPLCVSQLLVLL